MTKRIISSALAAIAFLTLTACSSEADSEYGSIKTVETPEDFQGNVGDVTLESGDTYAVITIKDYGDITCKLFEEAAPEGVQNFIELANSGYYDGKIIHRVIDDFMMQGGSANGDGRSVDTDPSFDVEYNSSMRHFYGALCYANAAGVNGSQFYIVNSKTYSALSESYFQGNIDYYQEYVDQLNELAESSTSDDEKEYYLSYAEYYSAMLYSAKSQLRALQECTDEILEKYEEVGGVPYLDGGYTVFGQTVDGFDVIDAISEVEVTYQSESSTEESYPVTEIVIESVKIYTVE